MSWCPFIIKDPHHHFYLKISTQPFSFGCQVSWERRGFCLLVEMPGYHGCRLLMLWQMKTLRGCLRRMRSSAAECVSCQEKFWINKRQTKIQILDHVGQLFLLSDRLQFLRYIHFTLHLKLIWVGNKTSFSVYNNLASTHVRIMYHCWRLNNISKLWENRQIFSCNFTEFWLLEARQLVSNAFLSYFFKSQPMFVSTACKTVS